MRFIAHRGLMHGANVNIENRPEQIRLARESGFDCEIDLWRVNSELYLGHDAPLYPISEFFLNDTQLWIHAKNLDALYWLTHTKYNYFWHQGDDFVLTSQNWIWTYPGKELTDRSVIVMPEWGDPGFKSMDFGCYAVCSDFVHDLVEIFRRRAG